MVKGWTEDKMNLVKRNCRIWTAVRWRFKPCTFYSHLPQIRTFCSYLDIKERTFVYQGKSSFFMLFGRKRAFSGKIRKKRASKQSIDCHEARFFIFRAKKQPKKVCTFWSFFTKTKHAKIVAPAGFELFACIFWVVFIKTIKRFYKARVHHISQEIYH